MTEDFNKDSINTFRESDVRREVSQTEASSRLHSGGMPISEAGKLREAMEYSKMSPSRETADRMKRLTEHGPPLDSSMDKEQYFHHKYARQSGSDMTKESMYGGSAFPGMAQGGIPQYTDPMNSPTRWGIPTWDDGMHENEKQQLQKEGRRWSNFYYHNHHVVVTCMDIYAQYPFVGLDIQCPDPDIEDEYRQVFFNDLKYQDLLPKANLQYYKNGEAPLLGNWDDVSKSWTRETILNSDDIHVVKWPGPDTDQEAYFWVPPREFIHQLEQMDANNPIFNYYINNFGEEKVMQWMEGYPEELPPDLFSVLRYKQEPQGTRGYPILQNAFPALMKEEKLNQAMTSVADRLYTPFLVAKLGSRDLMQGQYPWIPNEDDLQGMQAHLEMMMSSRYRMMVYHSGIEFETPFSNQTIPDLNEDLEGTTRDIMSVFGIPKELIQGGSAGTFASGALSAEIMMQRLAASQKIWSEWWINERARSIAEARGYYVVERKGGQYIKPMERVRTYDPETGRFYMRTRRKLMLPSIRMETMDWRDQDATAKALAQLRKDFDMPISGQYIAQFYDPNLNMDTEREQYAEEKMADNEMRENLRQMGIEDAPSGGGGGGMPDLGGPPGDIGGKGGPSGAPGGSDGPPSGGASGGERGDREGPGNMPGGGDRPPQSDERRDQEPRGASFTSFKTKPQKTATTQDPYDGLVFVDKDELGYITTASYEQNRLDKKLGSMSDDEFLKRHKKTADYNKGEVEPSETTYAERHMFNFVRSGGKKTGTLYEMDGNILTSRRVK